MFLIAITGKFPGSEFSVVYEKANNLQPYHSKAREMIMLPSAFFLFTKDTSDISILSQEIFNETIMTSLSVYSYTELDGKRDGGFIGVGLVAFNYKIRKKLIALSRRY